jgi:hypothetical protein
MIALAIAVGTAGLMHAQDGYWPRDRDRDDDYQYQRYDRDAYRDGFAQGQYDRQNNSRYNYRTHQWKHADRGYRDAYERGYANGFNSAYRDGGSYYPYGRDRRDDDPDYRNYPNGRDYPYRDRDNYPYRGNDSGYGNQAYDIGFRDGQADGRNDLLTGHSYRPTHDDNYKHADRGYNSSYGNKNWYKQTYRSGYVQGYERGYRR